MRPSSRHTATQNESSTSVIVHFPVPASDVGLVTALRAGHVGALRALCGRHSKSLSRVAAAILGPDENLLAIVAQGLRQSVETLDELDDARALRAWLVSRLIAVVKRRLKVRRRWRWLGLLWHSDAACNTWCWSGQLRASYRVLDRLMDDQRIVFCLAAIHGMSLADIATVLELPLSQVRSLLDRASQNFTRHTQFEPTLSVQKLRSA